MEYEIAWTEPASLQLEILLVWHGARRDPDLSEQK